MAYNSCAQVTILAISIMIKWSWSIEHAEEQSKAHVQMDLNLFVVIQNWDRRWDVACKIIGKGIQSSFVFTVQQTTGYKL